MTTIYDFKALSNKGEEVDMAQYKGKVLMIVNTFIEAHDLSGKTLNVFATSGGSGVNGSYNDLKKAYPQYTWGVSRLMN